MQHVDAPKHQPKSVPGDLVDVRAVCLPRTNLVPTDVAEHFAFFWRYKSRNDSLANQAAVFDRHSILRTSSEYRLTVEPHHYRSELGVAGGQPTTEAICELSKT